MHAAHTDHGGAAEPTPEVPRIAGYLAEFETPEDLKRAAVEVRDAGFKAWDCYSPFPVHGIDEAMGIKRTILPVLVFVAGFGGAIGGILLQWWTNAIDYPYLISGKPIFSAPANVPIVFETMVMGAAFTAGLGMLFLNNLPEWYHPTLKSEKFRRVTTDGFFLAISAKDPKFNPEKTRKLLEGFRNVTSVEALED